MDTDQIVIRQGLPDALTRRAAEIYYEAFGQKFKLFLGNRETIVDILADGFYASNAFTALQNGELVGLAGVQHDRIHFVHLRMPMLRQKFGWLGGLFKQLVFLVSYNRPYRPGELIMDGIGVDPALRGKGVGTLLLNAVLDFARKNRYQSVRLDVIDTNEGARRLYERVGFIPRHVQKLYGMKKYLGFAAVTEMVCFIR